MIFIKLHNTRDNTTEFLSVDRVIESLKLSGVQMTVLHVDGHENLELSQTGVKKLEGLKWN